MRTLARTIEITALVLAALILPTCVWAGPMNLSPAQMDQLKDFGSETREKTRRVRGELMRARMELFQGYRAWDLDERRVKAAIESVGKSQLALLNQHLDDQIALRRILNESQFKEFCRTIERHSGEGEHSMFSSHEEGPLDKLPDKGMLDAIGASADQSKRLAQFGESRERKAIIEKLGRDSRKIIGLYSDYDLDVPAARKLIDSIHDSQMDLADLNHRKQQALRSVLTRQQFDRLQDEIAKRIKSHEHERRRGPRRF